MVGAGAGARELVRAPFAWVSQLPGKTSCDAGFEGAIEMPEPAKPTSRSRARTYGLWLACLAAILLGGVVVVFRTRRPGPATCEMYALRSIHTYLVAQAAYSLYVMQDTGVARFAEKVSDLYYTERRGSPIALIPKTMADADSPANAYNGYYFSVIANDPYCPIDPKLDFAICATPVRGDCKIFVCRGTWGLAMTRPRPDSDELRAAALAPLATCPGDIDLATEGWFPAGPIAYVLIQRAGVAKGSMNWPDGEGNLLTTLDLEKWFRERRTRHK